MSRIVTVTKTLSRQDGTRFFKCDESMVSNLINTYTAIGYNVEVAGQWFYKK